MSFAFIVWLLLLSCIINLDHPQAISLHRLASKQQHQHQLQQYDQHDARMDMDMGASHGINVAQTKDEFDKHMKTSYDGMCVYWYECCTRAVPEVCKYVYAGRAEHCKARLVKHNRAFAAWTYNKQIYEGLVSPVPGPRMSTRKTNDLADHDACIIQQCAGTNLRVYTKGILDPTRDRLNQAEKFIIGEKILNAINNPHGASDFCNRDTTSGMEKKKDTTTGKEYRWPPIDEETKKAYLADGAEYTGTPGPGVPIPGW